MPRASALIDPAGDIRENAKRKCLRHATDRLRPVREQGLDRQTWWPAARDNNPAWLLGRTSDEAEE
jgi:hypothetical protein